MADEEHPVAIQRRTLGAVMSMVAREFAIKALAFGGWIVLARLLEPEVFGLFATASFALNLFLLVSETGLGAALVRERDVSNDDLSALFTYQLVWAAVLSGGLMLVAAVFSGPLGYADIMPVLQALAVSFFLISLRTVPSIISQRRLAYGPIVVSDVTSQVAYWLVAIGTAVAGWGVWSVAASALAFGVANTGILFLRTRWVPKLHMGWRATHLRAGFSLMYQGQQGASLAKYAMLPILGGLAAGSAGVGYVTWAHQIAVIPIQLTQLISRVSFPALALLQDNAEAFASMTRSILKWTCRVTFPACSLLIGLAPQIIVFVYGSKWLPAIVPFYLFTLNTAINAPVGVLLPTLYSLGRGRKAFRVLVIMLGLTWLVGLALAPAGVGLAVPAIAFLAGMLAALVAVLYELRDFGGVDLLRPLGVPLLSGVLGAVLLQVVGPVAVHSLVSLVTIGGGVTVLMLAANLWGDYGFLTRSVKSFLAPRGKNKLAGVTQAMLIAPVEERQDVSVGKP